jgi:hypothetical protein
MEEKKYTPQETDEMFALTYDKYTNDFLPVYKSRDLEPKTIIHFTALLPVYIPINVGDCITIGLNEKEFGTYWFDSLCRNEEIDVGLMGPKKIETEIYRTKVEMFYVADKFSQKVNRNQLSDIFDRLLDGLNLIITGYQILTKDVGVHRITKEMIQFASVYRIINVNDWYNFKCGLLLLHPNVPSKKTPLSYEKLEKVAWYTNILNQQWNPFMLSEELTLCALRHLQTGAYREAVIYSQMGIETLLKQLFIMFLTSEGKTLTEAEETLEETPFMPMVKKEFHSRLGGNWNPKCSNTIIGQWKRDTYRLRNRIVHAGYQPNHKEADQALDSAKKFRVYIVSLIKKPRNRKKYPKIESLFISKREMSKR